MPYLGSSYLFKCTTNRDQFGYIQSVLSVPSMLLQAPNSRQQTEPIYSPPENKQSRQELFGGIGGILSILLVDCSEWVVINFVKQIWPHFTWQEQKIVYLQVFSLENEKSSFERTSFYFVKFSSSWQLSAECEIALFILMAIYYHLRIQICSKSKWRIWTWRDRNLQKNEVSSNQITNT